MEGCLHSLYEDNDSFIRLVLSFVMHPKGIYRIAGRRIWDNFHLESSDFSPLDDLDENMQCVFIISMLQDLGNPETRLTKVLPLLDAKSEKVRNILMACLRPYLDDYMGHVIQALDKTTVSNDQSAKLIKSYFEDRSEVIQKRRGIKELSVRYRYGQEYREALRVQKEHMQGTIREAEAEHEPEWHKLMNTVLLARGGGWRDENGKVQHLPTFSFSMPARMLEQAMSPKEQDEWFGKLLKDWDDTAGGN